MVKGKKATDVRLVIYAGVVFDRNKHVATALGCTLIRWKQALHLWRQKSEIPKYVEVLEGTDSKDPEKITAARWRTFKAAQARYLLKQKVAEEKIAEISAELEKEFCIFLGKH